MPRHAFRLPSLHRLNTKDLQAPPTAINTSPSGSGYRPLTTPPAATNAHHGDSATLSPSSTTSSVPSTSSFNTAVSNSLSSSSSSSSSHPRLRHLLALRRKQSRINIEREIADEQARFGGPTGGIMSVMEPRPGVARGDGGAGGVVMGGIFEVLGGHR